MKTVSFKQRFVEWGGWVWVEAWRKPKTRVAWGFAAVWFGGWIVALSAFSEVSFAALSVAGIGQGVFVLAAIIVSAMEKPVLKKALMRNPDKKPEAFY